MTTRLHAGCVCNESRRSRSAGRAPLMQRKLRTSFPLLIFTKRFYVTVCAFFLTYVCMLFGICFWFFCPHPFRVHIFLYINPCTQSKGNVVTATKLYAYTIMH
jgi:hypothetical protein